ncbi:MAG: MBL fold metallo-hydrolase [Candidatus Pacebacteria bacterium]|nr:MBL fold metallo-hydrolase [Candidatus Paceibacterota bacterium]
MTAKITFYGGAGTVTGANFLLDTRSAGSDQVGKRILVDCGALERENPTNQICDEENVKPFAYDPKSIDVLFITHAHQDHIGRVPKLVRDGFRGVIISTPATKDISRIMFEDALSIMRDQLQKHGCQPVYEQHDVDVALSLWRTHEYHEPFDLNDLQMRSQDDSAGSEDSVGVEFLDAGHILGSAMVKLTRGDRTIIFSGDLGNTPEPLLNDLETPFGANYLVMESVYGDRVHEDRDARRDILKAAVQDIQRKQGTLLIPSFSVERTQVLLFELNEMIERKEIESIPVYFDAPLAIRVTSVFEVYRKDLNAAAQKEFEHGRDPFAFPSLLRIPTTRKSSEIHETPDPKIIIAGAGMSSGGRIRAHEKQYLPAKNAIVLLVGYQAPGSLGRRIQEGQKKVVIDGESIVVHAEIRSLSGYSGHADRDQLLSFAEAAGESLQKVFVVMGEPKSSAFLAQRIRDYLNVEAVTPAQNDTAIIDW